MLLVRKVFLDEADTYNATRILVIILSLGIIVGQFPSTKIFAMTPDGLINNFQLHTILTTTFVEVNIFVGICHVLIAFIAGAYLEKRWGTIRFVKFVVIVGLGSQLGVLFTMTFMYYLTFQEPYLYDPLCGFSCVAGGFTVGIAQLKYQEKIPNIPLFSFQYFPLTCFTFTLIATLLGAPFKEIWLVGYGIYFGWFYLRYFELHPDTSERGGDDRPEFALSRLFPPVVRIPVQVSGVLAYQLFNSIGCCRKPKEQKPAPAPIPEKDPALTVVPSTFETVASVDPEISKRRAKAIQDIENRIQAMQQTRITKTLDSSPGSNTSPEPQNNSTGDNNV